jgi:hypothetical protein
MEALPPRSIRLRRGVLQGAFGPLPRYEGPPAIMGSAHRLRCCTLRGRARILDTRQSRLEFREPEILWRYSSGSQTHSRCGFATSWSSHDNLYAAPVPVPAPSPFPSPRARASRAHVNYVGLLYCSSCLLWSKLSLVVYCTSLSDTVAFLFKLQSIH